MQCDDQRQGLKADLSLRDRVISLHTFESNPSTRPSSSQALGVGSAYARSSSRFQSISRGLAGNLSSLDPIPGENRVSMQSSIAYSESEHSIPETPYPSLDRLSSARLVSQSNEVNGENIAGGDRQLISRERGQGYNEENTEVVHEGPPREPVVQNVLGRYSGPLLPSTAYVAPPSTRDRNWPWRGVRGVDNGTVIPVPATTDGIGTGAAQPPSKLEQHRDSLELVNLQRPPQYNHSNAASSVELVDDPGMCNALRARFDTAETTRTEAGDYSNPDEVPAKLRVGSPGLPPKVIKRYLPQPAVQGHTNPTITLTEASPTDSLPASGRAANNAVPPVPPVPPLLTPTLIPKALNPRVNRTHQLPPSSASAAIRANESNPLDSWERYLRTSYSEKSLTRTALPLPPGPAPRQRPPSTPRLPSRNFSKLSRGRSLTPRALRRLSQLNATPADFIRPHFTLKANEARASRALGQTGGPRRISLDPDLESFRRPRSQSPDHPPDGGREAWTIAFCGFLGSFATWGMAWSFGIIAAYYKAFSLSGSSLSQISWIGSMQLFLLFFLSQPIGVAIDHGYFRIFTIVGAPLLVAGTFATSWCHTWAQFFVAQGLVSGTGMGLIFSSGAICMLDWFEVNVGKALALASAGSSIGAVVYTTIFYKLVLRIGFAWTFRAFGFITLVLLMPVVFFLRMRKTRRRDPSDLQKFSMADALRSYADPPFLVMSAGLFFAFWGLYFAITYFPVYAMQILSMSGPEAARVLIALCACNFVGRLVPGVLSDACCGPLNLMIPSCVLSAAFTLVWITSTNKGALVVVACLYGFACGGISALFSPTIQSYCFRDRKTMGAKTGFALCVIGLACLTGNPIGGALVREDWGRHAFLGAQLFAGISMLAAGALLACSRWMRVGWAPGRM